jgi:uncharacterized membrane protein
VPGSRAIGVSRRLDRTFRISIAIKGIDGGVEALAGLALLLTSPATLIAGARSLVSHEWGEDPRDAIETEMKRRGLGSDN